MRCIDSSVSIPKRDLGEFRQFGNDFIKAFNTVSIPKRDLGEFRPSNSKRDAVLLNGFNP